MSRTFSITVSDRDGSFVDLLAEVKDRSPEDYLRIVIKQHVQTSIEKAILIQECLDSREAARPSKPTRSGPLAREMRRAVFRRFNGRCTYCEAELDPFGSWHIDHKTPVSKGGSDDEENLVLACVPCNLAKSDKSVAEFIPTKRAREFKGT